MSEIGLSPFDRLMVSGNDARTLAEFVRHCSEKIAEARAPHGSHIVLDDDILRWSRLVDLGTQAVRSLDRDVWASLKAELAARDRLTETMRTTARYLDRLERNADDEQR